MMKVPVVQYVQAVQIVGCGETRYPTLQSQLIETGESRLDDYVGQLGVKL